MNRRTRLVLLQADVDRIVTRIILFELIVVAIAVTLALIDAAF